MQKNINFDTSLGEFVSKYPQSKDVFKHFELDYCCGGQKNLVTAAKEQSIVLDELKFSLQKIINEAPKKEKPINWDKKSLTEIIDYIEKKHHAFMWEKLPSSDMLINKLVDVHGEKHEDFLLVLKSIFAELKESLEQHLLTEEEIVFASIRKIEASKNKKNIATQNFTKETINILHQEHEETGKSLRKIKNFTSNYELPDYACESFATLYENLQAIEADLHDHIHLENTVLFPRIKKLIS